MFSPLKAIPRALKKGGVINALDVAEATPHALIFHAGTKQVGDKITANGGRVLNICGQASTVTQAAQTAYQTLDLVQWQDGFCRRDIAYRAIEREQI